MASRRCFTSAFLAMALFVCTIDCRKKDTKQHLPRFPQARGLCQNNEYQCHYGNCISLDQVCDTHRDCLGGDDENSCPTDCTGQNQFKCENSNKCIGLIDRCDGTADCTDYSDEAFCSVFECPAGEFKCIDSKECINKDYVCDRTADCQDGSDERGCYNGTCSSSHWMCADKDRCIPNYYVCDHDPDCADGSDEVGCTCTASHFQCTNGGCIPASYKCDGDNDCGDHSDEAGCPGYVGTCADVLTFADCFHMNETTHPICTIHADADKLCRKFCGLCT